MGVVSFTPHPIPETVKYILIKCDRPIGFCSKIGKFDLQLLFHMNLKINFIFLLKLKI